MPVEPVTPPDSTVWRAIHFPVGLGIVAAGLLLAVVFGIQLLGVALRLVPYVPGARYVVPLIAAAAILAFYWVFVRLVERRARVDEFEASGWLREFGLGAGIGLGVSLASFAALVLLGSLRVTGVNPAYVMLLPLVVQLCTAIILEILLRGVVFRLAERLLGSWLALLLIAGGVAAVAFLNDGAPPRTVLATVLQIGLVCAALYMVTRRLWAAIGLNAAWNFAQIALYGVAVSPTGPHGLIVSRMIGPDGMTGGEGGPNVSAPALVAHTLLLVALLTLAIRRGRIVRPMWQRGRRG